jgi:hypothetical protein
MTGNRVLRRIFGLREGCYKRTMRIAPEASLLSYYCIAIARRVSRMASITHGRNKKLVYVLLGETVGKRSLGRHRHRWEINNFMEQNLF